VFGRLVAQAAKERQGGVVIPKQHLVDDHAHDERELIVGRFSIGDLSDEATALSLGHAAGSSSLVSSSEQGDMVMLKCFQNRAAKLAPSCRAFLTKVGKLK
jgi:hypothetical protein